MIVQKILITTMPISIVFSLSINDPIYNHLWASITIISGILVFAKLSNNNLKNITHEQREKNKTN